MTKDRIYLVILVSPSLNGGLFLGKYFDLGFMIVEHLIEIIKGEATDWPINHIRSMPNDVIEFSDRFSRSPVKISKAG